MANFKLVPMSNPTSAINIYDYECIKKCKFEHGNVITSAITERYIDDERLVRFIAEYGRNFSQVVDSKGRSALHMASSTNRYSIAEWLLNHGAAINASDQESGSTSLHRALFYGCVDIAVLLLRYGANPEITDKDFLNPLQNIFNISSPFDSSMRGELLVWGENKNYNLGIGDIQSSMNPQYVDYFHKRNIHILSMAISSYHSLYLDSDSRLYGVGHGKGGRLGNGTESILLSPKEICIPTLSTHQVYLNEASKNDHITQISCAKYHSLISTRDGRVFACGVNKFSQLGIGQRESNRFREIPGFNDCYPVKSVIAKEQHSLAVTDHSIYVWGTNNGQFGLTSDIQCIHQPYKIKMNDQIKIRFVESSNTATCIVSQYNIGLGKLFRYSQILLYHNYKTKLFKFPFMVDPIIGVCLAEKDTDLKKCDKNKKRKQQSCIDMLVYSSSEIFLWDGKFQQLFRCYMVQDMRIVKILFKKYKILLLSDAGDLYEGRMIKIKRPENDNTTKVNDKNSNSIENNLNNHFFFSFHIIYVT